VPVPDDRKSRVDRVDLDRVVRAGLVFRAFRLRVDKADGRRCGWPDGDDVGRPPQERCATVVVCPAPQVRAHLVGDLRLTEWRSEPSAGPQPFDQLGFPCPRRLEALREAGQGRITTRSRYSLSIRRCSRAHVTCWPVACWVE